MMLNNIIYNYDENIIPNEDYDSLDEFYNFLESYIQKLKDDIEKEDFKIFDTEFSSINKIFLNFSNYSSYC